MAALSDADMDALTERVRTHSACGRLVHVEVVEMLRALEDAGYLTTPGDTVPDWTPGGGKPPWAGGGPKDAART